MESDNLLGSRFSPQPGNNRNTASVQSAQPNQQNSARGASKFWCSLCCKPFKDRNGLQNHIENAFGHRNSCKLCLITFYSSSGLKRHLSSSSKHVWCKTCNRRFSSQAARDKHWEKTSRHRHCMIPNCEFDSIGDYELSVHLKTIHFQCGGCGELFLSLSKSRAHKTATFGCEICGVHSLNANNRKQHMLTHAPTNIACWACDGTYRTASGMILHLESGFCPCLIDTMELNKLLASWFGVSFIDPDYLFDLYDGKDLKKARGEEPRPFFCCGCEERFLLFSAFVQHLECGPCEQSLKNLALDELKELFRNEFVKDEDGSFQLL